ncbi:MAG: hypothetical protein IPM12_06395 [Flavobacteriales bacterium]|nr:hypothetical protein [Flavobacteriales bacterium]
MATVKENPKSPWPHYFSIGAGVCIVALAFFKEGLSTVDIIKLLLGVGLIGYGIWKLVANKKTP